MDRKIPFHLNGMGTLFEVDHLEPMPDQVVCHVSGYAGYEDEYGCPTAKGSVHLKVRAIHFGQEVYVQEQWAPPPKRGSRARHFEKLDTYIGDLRLQARFQNAPKSDPGKVFLCIKVESMSRLKKNKA